MKNYLKYLNTYAGKKLLERHDLEEVGTWRIVGEDHNCDMGGTHVQPYLTTMEGRLYDVLREATEMGDFWNWGAGGDVIKISIQSANKYPSPPVQKPLTKMDELIASLSPDEIKELKSKL